MKTWSHYCMAVSFFEINRIWIELNIIKSEEKSLLLSAGVLNLFQNRAPLANAKYFVAPLHLKFKINK